MDGRQDIEYLAATSSCAGIVSQGSGCSFRSGIITVYGSFLYLKEKSIFQVGKQIFFVSPQIANPQITIQQNFLGVPARKLQIRIFVRINPQIANPQMSLVSRSANRKSANI
jgi:hypothetical protein